MTTIVEVEPQFALERETEKYRHYSRKIPHKYSEYENMYDSEEIYVFDDMVMVKKTSKRSRTYRKSGKTGFYFVKTYEMTYSARNRTRDGEPMFRIRNGHGDFTYKTPHHSDKVWDAAIALHVKELVKRQYGLDVPDEWMNMIGLYRLIAYPMFREWVLPHHANGSPAAEYMLGRFYLEPRDGFRELSRGFLRSTPRAFVEQSFGKRFLHKDFIKEVASNQNSRRMAVLSKYRKHFSGDLGLTFLRSNTRLGMDIIYDQNTDKAAFDFMLKPLNEHQKRRVLMADAPKRNHHVTDSIRIMDDLVKYGSYEHERVDFRNWETIHVSLIIIYRDQKRAMNEEAMRQQYASLIPQENYYPVLDGTMLSFDNGVYTFQSAKNVGEVIDWGTEMYNCIGSYGYAAAKNETYLFALYKDTKMVANLELDTAGELKQFVGKHNKSFAVEFNDVVEDHIIDLIST